MRSAGARGVFTLSFDFELIWGTLDLFGSAGFGERCRVEREEVFERLLTLLESLEIPATWLVVGHLFLDRCQPVDGVKHPEITRPNHAWVRGDWFEADPAGTEATAPNFYARSLVERLRRCPVRQEIGCHSFSHVIFSDPGCSPSTADSEFAECVRAARTAGVEPRSFAFPRNAVGHLPALRAHGFRSFRGVEPRWYARGSGPVWLRRLAHIAEFALARTPPVVWPEEAGGVWNVPGSMIYLPMHGIRRHLPVSCRVRRAQKGLAAASAQGGLFHLWMHPTNLVDEMEAMFAGLRRILESAAELRAAGRLEILTMDDVVDVAQRERELPPA